LSHATTSAGNAEPICNNNFVSGRSVQCIQCSAYSAVLEKYENSVFTLKTHQMFSVPTTPGKLIVVVFVFETEQEMG